VSALSLAFKFARRELRSGFSGFRIFLASLTLGVAAIAGVGSLGEAFLVGLSEQGRTLLGGDIEMERLYQPASADEAAFMRSYGTVSEVVSMRSMAGRADGGRRTLVDIKAVDNLYPLVGQPELRPATSLRDALACYAQVCGAAVEEGMLARLGARMGDIIRIGTANIRVRAILVSEPDRIAGGLTWGPRVMISREAVNRANLVQFGSLVNYSYKIAFTGQQTIEQFRAAVKARYDHAGWDVDDRNNAEPGIARFVRQATMFLTLIGLTALIVGGVGAAQAVGAFIERRRATIATLKALGAEGREIFLTYLLQVLYVAVIGIVLGLVLGAILPFAVERLAGDAIPAPAHYDIYAEPLILAAVFGLVAALGFAILPLARAREIAPAGLFRDLVAPSSARGRWPYLVAAAIAFAAIGALSVALSPYPEFSLYFLGGAAAVLIVLRIAGGLLRRALARFPHRRTQITRLAFANLTRPGTPAVNVIVALGLGLTLLATVALVQASVQAQVKDQIPDRAPTFFFVDIQKDQFPAFRDLVSKFPTASDFDASPMLRGRIVKVAGVPSEQVKAEGNARGLLNGDRGVTYAATAPKGTNLVEGEWWPADYKGPTLVSFSAQFAHDLHLKIGDMVTINILGREFDARVHNLREVNFRTGGINFFMVFSPGVLDSAPHTYLSTVRVAPGQEDALFDAVSGKFTNVTIIRVREALAQVNDILQSLADAIGIASLVTILAGLLVLAGAIASGHRARLYDAVVLKVLGATRARLAAVYTLEYGVLGILAGITALGAGLVAAWGIAKFVIEVPLVVPPAALALTILGGAAATLLLGLAAGFAALGAKPAARLRNP
jgi:putative ABC transport system permease protein